MKKQPTTARASVPPTQPAAPTPIRLGRVTITGDVVELDEGFLEAVTHAARTRTFAERVLSNLMFLNDIARARGNVMEYLKQCLAAGDIEGVERWASCGYALDELAAATGEDIEKHWPPSSRQAFESAPAMSDEDKAAEAEAAAELERERQRMREGKPAGDPVGGALELQPDGRAVIRDGVSVNDALKDREALRQPLPGESPGSYAARSTALDELDILDAKRGGA